MPLARINADAVHHRPGEVAPAARERDGLILTALRRGTATLDGLVRLTGISQAVLTADLPFLVAEGRVVRAGDMYSLPETR